jgi:hypothetical protein
VSKKLIEKLRKDRDEYKATAETLLAKMETGDELSEGERSTLADARAEAIKLDERITDISQWESQRLDQARRESDLDGKYREVREQVPTGQPEKSTTLGEQVTRSSEWGTYLQAPSGNSALMKSEYALVSTVDANTKYLPGVYRARESAVPTRRTPLLDVLGYEPVSTNSIDWVEWPLLPPVPAAPTAEGAAKPEATYAPLLRAGTLDKVAQHIPVTRETLEDVPRAQAIISGALMDGVKMKVEALAGAALVAATLPAVSDDTLLKAIRVGVATVQTVGFQPTTCVINPLDYGQIDIELLGLTLAGARRDSPVWGLNIVPAPVVPAGTAYVGDFTAGMTLFDRQVVGIHMTDSHAAEFVSNILRILAEVRMKAIVIRPEAIVECTVGAATTREGASADKQQERRASR